MPTEMENDDLFELVMILAQLEEDGESRSKHDIEWAAQYARELIKMYVY